MKKACNFMFDLPELLFGRKFLSLPLNNISRKYGAFFDADSESFL